MAGREMKRDTLKEKSCLLFTPYFSEGLFLVRIQIIKDKLEMQGLSTGSRNVILSGKLKCHIGLFLAFDL